MAWRNSGMPALGVYFVKPDSNASIAALLMCSGVSKSGSPAPKPQTSMPSAFMAFALLSIESVSDGVSWAARSEISMLVSYVKWEHPPASPGEALRAGKLLVAIEVFNERFEIIFFNSDNRHLALRVFDGI